MGDTDSRSTNPEDGGPRQPAEAPPPPHGDPPLFERRWFEGAAEDPAVLRLRAWDHAAGGRVESQLPYLVERDGQLCVARPDGSTRELGPAGPRTPLTEEQEEALIFGKRDGLLRRLAETEQPDSKAGSTAGSRLFRVLHNAVAHPLLALTSAGWAVRFHDWTGARGWGPDEADAKLDALEVLQRAAEIAEAGEFEDLAGALSALALLWSAGQDGAAREALEALAASVVVEALVAEVEP